MQRIAFTAGLIFFLAFWSQAFGQSQTSKFEELHFSEFWVWEYPNEYGELQEFGIFRSPERNFWLLTLDSYGATDGMTKWFLLKPSGQVVQSYASEHGGGDEYLQHRLPISRKQKLPNNWTRESDTKQFGTPEESFGIFEGRAYTSTNMADLGSTFYFSPHEASFAPLAYFNDLEIDAKLPVYFSRNIPTNWIPLAQYHGQRGKIFEFKGVFPTSYYIRIPR